jgi:hypothetical protein
MSRIMRLAGKASELLAIALAWASFGQTASNAQTFPLSDTKDLVPLNVKADAIEYKGRKAVRLTKDTEKDGFALLRGTDFQDGAIEADIALKITAPPGVFATQSETARDLVATVLIFTQPWALSAVTPSRAANC